MAAAAAPTIRDARRADAAAVHAIYAHHVLHGTASYDVDPPSVDQMADKIAWVRENGWPFLVAACDGTIAAYAYATQFRDRAAYRFTAENSIYVHPDWVGRGIGKALLQRLIGRSAEFGFRTMVVVYRRRGASVHRAARCVRLRGKAAARGRMESSAGGSTTSTCSAIGAVNRPKIGQTLHFAAKWRIYAVLLVAN